VLLQQCFYNYQHLVFWGHDFSELCIVSTFSSKFVITHCDRVYVECLLCLFFLKVVTLFVITGVVYGILCTYTIILTFILMPFIPFLLNLLRLAVLTHSMAGNI